MLDDAIRFVTDGVGHCGHARRAAGTCLLEALAERQGEKITKSTFTRSINGLYLVSVVRDARICRTVVIRVLIPDLLADEDKVIRRCAAINLVSRNVAASVIGSDPAQIGSEIVAAAAETSRLGRGRLC